MKKLTIYFLVLTVLAHVSSCTRFEETDIAGEAKRVEMTFKAVISDDARTKTMVEGTAGETFRNTLWLPQDEIGVIAEGSSTVDSFRNQMTENSTSASFAGTTVLAEKYYALFPYQANMRMDGTSMYLRLPASQNYAAESFGPKAMPMVAKVESGNDLYFKNLCGGFILNITGTDVIKSIQFTGYDEAGNAMNVSGDFMVDMSYETDPVIISTGNGSSTVAINCGNEGVILSENEATSFHFVLPPATYYGFSIIIHTIDGKMMLKESDKELNIRRSNLTNAAAFAFEENFFGFDLSEKGTANSYIVSEEGYYHFDATVMGNGVFGLVEGMNFHTTYPSLIPDTAELLWEDTEGVITGVSFDGQDISFTATGVEGNALIVAKNEKDEIIWSWHIWATDLPQEHIYTNSTGNYTVLDRNIGAIRADRGTGDDEWLESIGLVYQIGRKDPFYVTKDSEYWYDRVNTRLSIEESIKMPSTFPYGYEFWDNQDMAETYWQPNVKTIYDPCPVGYKVAVSDVWAGFTVDGGFADRLDEMTVSGSFDHGWYFYYDGVNTAWYPTYKFISYWGDPGYHTTEARLWKADTQNGNYVRYYYNSDYECSFDRYSWNNRSEAIPVRCMKDDIQKTVIVTIDDVRNVTSTTADVSARIAIYGNIEVIESGFVVGDQASVTVTNGIVFSTGTAGNEISTQLTELTELSRYYVKAFVTTSDGTFYSSVKSFITPGGDGIINLSAGGPANCYIVKPVFGTYSFDMVKGNGTEPVGDAVTAEILWETYNTASEVTPNSVIASVEIDGSKVRFSMPEHPLSGNAVIAVRDAEGVILWSWHIWVSDFDPDAKAQTYISGAVMMDRNLGALNVTMGDEKSFGLYYQWGRKDPFPGATKSWVSAYTSTNAKSYADTADDYEFTVQNPATVISGGSWNDSEDLWNAGKTIYDPCPAGWRVPDITAWNGITDLTWHGNWNGVTFTSPYSTPDAFYPTTGYTDGYTEIYWIEYGSFCLSSTSCHNTIDTYAIQIGNTNDMSASVRKDCEMSVRCMKMDDSDKEADGDDYIVDDDYIWE